MEQSCYHCVTPYVEKTTLNLSGKGLALFSVYTIQLRGGPLPVAEAPVTNRVQLTGAA